MSDNILKQLYSNSTEVSKDLKSVETTLGKILKLEEEQEKFDKKREKDRKKAKNDEAREEKRKAADFQGFKGIVKMKKKEKDEEKKGLFDMLLGGIGGAVKNVVGGITSTLQNIVGSIGGIVTGAIGSLGLGAMLTSALVLLKPVLIGALVAGAGYAATKLLTDSKWRKALDSIIGKKLDEMGLGWLLQSSRAGQQGYSADDAQSIVDSFERRGTSSMATEEEKSKYRAMQNIVEARREIADLGGAINHANQRILDLQAQIERDKEKTGLFGEKIDPQRNLNLIEEQQEIIAEAKEEIIEKEKFIAASIRIHNMADLYEQIGWTEPVKRQVGGHINVPGVGDGDKVPMMLPQGSFVLNKMASMHFQTGGMIPTLLEPGEKVFMPGDWDSSIEQLNSMIPRFQTGGYVGADRSTMIDTGEVDYKGRKVLLSPAAAAAWEQMMAAGMPYNPSEIANVYRDATEYQRLINAGYGAAHNSAHNFGEAADIHGAMNSWIRRHGSQYGWMANDYTGSHGGHFEFMGASGTRSATGEVEAALESSTKGFVEQATGMLSGVQDAFGGFMSGLGAFGEGFSEGFMGTLDSNSPVRSLIDGVMGLGDSIGNLFSSNPLSNLFGGDQGGTSNPPGSGVTPGAVSVSDPNARALLNAIAKVEGTDGHPNNGYNTMFTGRQFSGNQHPRQRNSSGRYASDAAGRYQFLSSTWDEYSNGRDFSPSNQDAVALDLVSKKRKVDLSDGLSMKEIYRLGQEWASIEGGPKGVPGGSYNGQAKYTAAQFMEIYRLNGGQVQGMQTGGRIGRSSSALQKRLADAQASHSAAMQINVKPIVVYEDEAPPAVAVSGGLDLMPPELPDGPGSDMAADYFYNLALGVQ